MAGELPDPFREAISGRAIDAPLKPTALARYPVEPSLFANSVYRRKQIQKLPWNRGVRLEGEHSELLGHVLGQVADRRVSQRALTRRLVFWLMGIEACAVR